MTAIEESRSCSNSLDTIPSTTFHRRILSLVYNPLGTSVDRIHLTPAPLHLMIEKIRSTRQNTVFYLAEFSCLVCVGLMSRLLFRIDGKNDKRFETGERTSCFLDFFTRKTCRVELRRKGDAY